MSNWIDVNDRLPEIGKEVLGHLNDGDMGRSEYYGSDGWDFEDVYVGADITHWQPLPEPPQ